MKQKRTNFDAQIEQALGAGFKPSHYKGDPDVETPIMPPYGDDQGGKPQMRPIRQCRRKPPTRRLDGKRQSRWTKTRTGWITERQGQCQPMRDTRNYNVLFPDGSEVEYTANVIAENMWAQADCQVNQYLLLDSITDHRTTDKAVSDDQSFIVKDGIKYPRKTTKGWEMCIQ
jgi:hypothetical protein